MISPGESPRKLLPVIFITACGFLQATVGYFLGRWIAGDGPFAGLAAGIVAIVCLWLGLFVGVAFARSIWRIVESTPKNNVDRLVMKNEEPQAD
jgi:hypothetical protein